MSHICELQHKLSENKANLYTARIGSNSSSSSRSNNSNSNSNTTTSSSNNKYYRSRTAASIEKDKKDASELLELGVSPYEVSDLLGISPRELARIEEDNQRRRKFLMTGNLDYIYS
jgi:hypothetical protein